TPRISVSELSISAAPTQAAARQLAAATLTCSVTPVTDTSRMSNDALLWNSPPPPPRKPQPGERLWSLLKDGRQQVHAELRVHRESGVECQFWYEGELVSARVWTQRAA